MLFADWWKRAPHAERVRVAEAAGTSLNAMAVAACRGRIGHNLLSRIAEATKRPHRVSVREHTLVPLNGSNRMTYYTGRMQNDA